MKNIRAASVTDIKELNELYQSTILNVNSRDYSQEEVEDWASCGNDIKKWEEQLAGDFYFVVAENEEKRIVGFASIRNDGYLHLLFVHKNFQSQGVASLLYKNAEEYAAENKITKIFSEVSITARGFFEKQGFMVDEEQRRTANKLSLKNFKISKMILVSEIAM